MSAEINIRKLCRDVEEKISVRALSLEMEIILELFFEGPQSVTELLGRIHASQATFGIIARRMLQQGNLVATPASDDKRRTIYSVSEECYRRISACIAPNSTTFPTASIAVRQDANVA